MSDRVSEPSRGIPHFLLQRARRFASRQPQDHVAVAVAGDNSKFRGLALLIAICVNTYTARHHYTQMAFLPVGAMPAPPCRRRPSLSSPKGLGPRSTPSQGAGSQPLGLHIAAAAMAMQIMQAPF
jgi:hypothetical protein